ncbi:MAG: pilus assembly protein TadG-related protein [Anaerolineales bacterium]
MKKNRSEKGQALILIVFAVIGLLALTGLAVDGSQTYVNRQGAQNAAETAALTGALDLANSNASGVVNDAKSAASTNGFPAGPNTTITVNPGSSGFTAGCNGTTPSFSPNNAQYVQVIIQTNVPTSFSSIVGVKQTHNCVDAIARGQSGSTGSMFNGAAIVSTDNASGCNQTMLFNGSANVTTTGGSIFDNCGGSSAVLLNGGVTLSMTGSGQDVGGILNNGGNTITPGITTGAVGFPMPAAAWSSIPAIPSTPTCSGNGSVNPISDLSGTSVTVGSGTATLTPGNFSSINVNSGSGTVTFSPGTYCLSGSINQSGGTLTGPSGTVNLVMGSNSVNQNTGTDTFNDLEMYFTSGSWVMNGTTSLNATKLRYYSTGSSSMTVNGGDTLTSSNSFFYLTSGTVTWNGSSTINLQAPPTGDPYAGLALYMPWSNTSSFILNGGSGVNITGTLLAPHSNITANGASNFQSLNSQIVGYTFIFNGGGTFKVNFSAGQNYGTPTTAYVDLIK